MVRVPSPVPSSGKLIRTGGDHERKTNERVNTGTVIASKNMLFKVIYYGCQYCVEILKQEMLTVFKADGNSVSPGPGEGRRREPSRRTRERNCHAHKYQEVRGRLCYNCGRSHWGEREGVTKSINQ